ncbi:hypothetical protein BDZ85DRAFT_253274 [Elsinoe ampelina]|uniref:2EXR domain-containing protein n=1 Tax=Elsinoe ampelina TaxID=302913 RepID=A0A6A6FZG0_9PEZI|nr:hypothetical protein BDZ85DRAFT_253274 [Elsinoe ampelina]
MLTNTPPPTKKKRAAASSRPTKRSSKPAAAAPKFHTTTSTTAIANATFAYQFGSTDAPTQLAAAGQVNAQSILVASQNKFDVTPFTFRSGPMQGQFALVFTAQPADHEIFRFLDLPAEIRAMILEKLVIHGPEAIVILNLSNNRDCKFRSKTFEAAKLSIMGVCKQIRQEALAMFLGGNTFRLGQTSTALHFLELYGDSTQYLRTIEIDHLLKTGNNQLMRALANLPTLQRVRFDRGDLRRLSAERIRPYFSEQGLTKKTAHSDAILAGLDRFLGLIGAMNPTPWRSPCDFMCPHEDVNGLNAGERSQCDACHMRCYCHAALETALIELREDLKEMLKIEEEDPVG